MAVPRTVLIDAWKREGRFFSPAALLNFIADTKDISPESRAVFRKANHAFVHEDHKIGMYPKMEHMLGLADLYAEETQQPTYMIDLDVSNCNGAGMCMGSGRVYQIFKMINLIFLEELEKSGASFVFGFDSARNDDFKIVTGGITEDVLADALQSAQERIDTLLLFAATVPHSKRQDRQGVGVGVGYCTLGQKQDAATLSATLEEQVEKSKDTSYFNRMEKLADSPQHNKPSNEEICREADRLFQEMFPQEAELTSFHAPAPDMSETGDTPLMTRRIEAIMTSPELKNLTAKDRSIFTQFARFYCRPDELTSATGSRFLLSDIQAIGATAQQEVGLMNIKLENCAGVNKVLSHKHSIEMTRDFVEKLAEFLQQDPVGKNNVGTYYIGRNSFNILFSQPLSAQDLLGLQQRMQEQIEGSINNQSIRSYFNRLGTKLPADFGAPTTKMGEIPNLRGNQNGIRIINFAGINVSSGISEDRLNNFHDRAITQTLKGMEVIKTPQTISRKRGMGRKQ